MLPKRIGPYRIEGQLGEGGMGEVYRAYDTELDRSVAVKRITAAELADPTAGERLRREARNAAKLTHPAVVQIFHLLSEDGYDYIVMELVEGRTLTQLLRDGPLESLRAATLFREIAEGLAAAHAENIVHRDIKAQNVMVTPEDHAKILDFGIAKRLESSERSLTARGTAVGTLHTMSPEQAQGERVDHRSDLFSLGVVLYQALTGEAPFRADSAREVLARICMHHPPPVAELDPKIPPALSRLIVELLQKNREDRPQTAAEVAVRLGAIVTADGEMTGPTAPVLPPLELPETLSATIPARGQVPDRPGLGRRRGYLLAVLGVVLIALLAAIELQRTPTLRPSVAVLGLETLSDRTENAWLATAIAEMLVTELGAGGQIRVVGSGEVARVRRELVPGNLRELTGAEFARLGRSLGVEHLVWGTWSDPGGQEVPLVRVELRLRDLVSDDNLASLGSTGTRQQLFTVVDRIAREFREQLGARALTPAQELEVEASLPTSLEAARLYSEGLARLRQLDVLASRDLLQAAIEAEPEHPMPYAALAEAWSTLGYERQARAAAAKARELASSLSETARRGIEARYHATAQEWDEAARIYSVLVAASPDDVDLGLKLADAQIEGGELPQALVTLESLRTLPEPLAIDPRIDLTQARAAYRQGKADETRVFAERAARKGEALGAPLLVAEARLRQTTALQNLGEHQQAQAALEEAIRLFKEHGDRQGSARALEAKAHAVLDQDELAGARRLFENAQAVYLEIGNRRRAAAVQGTLASILNDQGQLQEAVEVLEQTLATFRELGDQHAEAIVLNELGFNFYRQGEWQAAVAKYTEVLALSDELRNQQGAAVALTNLAEISFVLGELDKAQEMHEEALAINREISDQVGVAYDTFRLGKILAARGDLFAARRKYDQALKIQSDLGEAAAAAETRVALALLEFDQGDMEEAEEQAWKSEEVLRNEGFRDLATLARTVVVRALLAQGRLAEARQVMADVEAGAAESEDRLVGLVTAIAAARVRAMSPEQALAAVAELDRIAAEADAAGYVETHLEARLAAGKIELASGEAAAASTRLTVLRGEAESRGYRWIARRAAAAAPSRPGR